MIIYILSNIFLVEFMKILKLLPSMLLLNCIVPSLEASEAAISVKIDGVEKTLSMKDIETIGEFLIYSEDVQETTLCPYYNYPSLEKYIEDLSDIENFLHPKDVVKKPKPIMELIEEYKSNISCTDGDQSIEEISEPITEVKSTLPINIASSLSKGAKKFFEVFKSMDFTPITLPRVLPDKISNIILYVSDSPDFFRDPLVEFQNEVSRMINQGLSEEEIETFETHYFYPKYKDLCTAEKKGKDLIEKLEIEKHFQEKAKEVRANDKKSFRSLWEQNLVEVRNNNYDTVLAGYVDSRRRFFLSSVIKLIDEYYAQDLPIEEMKKARKDFNDLIAASKASGYDRYMITSLEANIGPKEEKIYKEKVFQEAHEILKGIEEIDKIKEINKIIFLTDCFSKVCQKEGLKNVIDDHFWRDSIRFNIVNYGIII